MALVQECMFTVNGALIWARDTYARMGYARVDSAITRLPSWVTCRYEIQNVLVREERGGLLAAARHERLVLPPQQTRRGARP